MGYAGHAGLIHDSSASVAYSAPGKPLKISDMHYPRPNTRLEEATAIVTMLIFFGCANCCLVLHTCAIIACQCTSAHVSLVSFYLHGLVALREGDKSICMWMITRLA